MPIRPLYRRRGRAARPGLRRPARISRLVFSVLPLFRPPALRIVRPRRRKSQPFAHAGIEDLGLKVAGRIEAVGFIDITRATEVRAIEVRATEVRATEVRVTEVREIQIMVCFSPSVRTII